VMDPTRRPQLDKGIPVQEILMNATNDPMGPPRLFVQFDLANAYLQGRRPKDPEDSKIFVLVSGNTCAPLIGNLNGHPTAGLQYQDHVRKNFPPEVQRKMYVDDYMSGKHRAQDLVEETIQFLTSMHELGATLQMRKFFMTTALCKFQLRASKDGVEIDSTVLETLGRMEVPKDKQDFVSKSALIRYFGRHLPRLVIPLQVMSDHFHGKSEMPSKEKIQQAWERIMNVVKNHVTLNWMSEDAPTFISTDW
jgi:hypothetical protein